MGPSFRIILASLWTDRSRGQGQGDPSGGAGGIPGQDDAGGQCCIVTLMGPFLHYKKMLSYFVSTWYKDEYMLYIHYYYYLHFFL